MAFRLRFKEIYSIACICVVRANAGDRIADKKLRGLTTDGSEQIQAETLRAGFEVAHFTNPKRQRGKNGPCIAASLALFEVAHFTNPKRQF